MAWPTKTITSYYGRTVSKSELTTGQSDVGVPPTVQL